MKKILITVLLGALLKPAFALESATANIAEIYSEKGTLANLYQQNLLTKESYTRLLEEGLDPEKAVIEVSYSRDIDALVSQVKGVSADPVKISDVSTPMLGDLQQTRWQREESGRVFNYLNTYQYFDDRNWMDVYFSRTLVETIGSSEASEK